MELLQGDLIRFIFYFIPMEKLIELLNEFETPQSWVVFKSYDDYDWTFYWVDCDWETEIAWSDSFVCGKRFWWIEWLVENDKIDRDNQALQYAKSDLSKFFTEWKDKNWMSDDYAMLLMLLAIQDEPIRFLCDILK